MEILYLIAKALVVIVCVSSALLLLYLSFKARMFLVSLKELESLLKADIQKLLLKSSLGMNTVLGFIFKPSGNRRTPFSLLAYIIDMVKSR